MRLVLPLILHGMLNFIWLAMLLVAVLAGGFGGRFDAMTEGAFSTAKSAVMEIALPLVGLMAVWLGMMRLAERAGLVQLLARALRPVMRRLFPDVPPEHPAMGAMVLNMSANMLGLGNAATPLGLRAMALLQKLNLNSRVASNSMVTFLAVNTASIQLIPTTAISILAVQGSRNASIIVVPAMIATAIGMACGIAASKLFARLPVFSAREAEAAIEVNASEARLEEVTVETVNTPDLTGRGRIILALFIAVFAFLFAMFAFPDSFAGWKAADAMRGAAYQKALPHAVAPALATSPALLPAFTLLIARADTPGSTLAVLQAIGLLAVPFLLAFFPLYAALRGVKVYEQFCEGAKEAFPTALRIIPFLVAMLVGIRLLREAGVVQFVTDGLRPFLATFGFPADLLPLVAMRPLSGSASQGIFVDLVRAHGADSLISRMAATIYGSTETTFYVLAVYFGSVGIHKTRHAVIAGLTADFVAMAAAIAACRLLAGP
jgi:spore maturation protein SpmA